MTDTPETRLDAIGLVLPPTGFVCGLTSAWAYGITVNDPRSDLLWLGHEPGKRLRHRAGVLIHELSVVQTDLQYVRRVLMTNELRTAFDCARWLSLVEAVVVVDALAHGQRFRIGDLSAYLANHPGLPGNPQVAKVVALADPLSESPMETRLRVLIERSGLPRPESQVKITDANGRIIARADLAYPLQQIAIEYDGALHWNQRRADDRRRDAIRAAGWRVIVVSAEDYYRTPADLVARVRSALAT